MHAYSRLAEAKESLHAGKVDSAVEAEPVTRLHIMHARAAIGVRSVADGLQMSEGVCTHATMTMAIRSRAREGGVVIITSSMALY